MSTTAAAAAANYVTPDVLIDALYNLSPKISGLIVGLHGVGKSQIAQGVADHLRKKHPEYEWPVFDKRLAQMVEGDLTGIPGEALVAGIHKTTRFLPPVWWMEACVAPAVIILEELNRAEIQMMNGGFQIVGAHELGGFKLHPLTRVIACINPPTHYQVQEMDKALVDRFMVFWLKSDPPNWIRWARGRLDDTLVDFIQESPTHLHHDVSKTEDLEVAPTPRSWEKFDEALRHANLIPDNYGGVEAPTLMIVYANGLLGRGTANAFLKWLRKREQFLSVENVLNDWGDPKIRKLAGRLRHEEILSCIDRIGKHSTDNTWTGQQVKNLVEFSLTCTTGEDQVSLFSKISSSGNQQNLLKVHNTPLTEAVTSAVAAARAVSMSREKKN